MIGLRIGVRTAKNADRKAPPIGLTSQYSWILTGRIAGATVQAIGLILVARWSGPAEFGLFAASYGIAVIAQAFTDFGLSQYIVRLRVADSSDGTIGAALRLGRRVSIVSALAGTAAVVALATHNSRYWALLLIPLWVASEKQVEAWLSVSLADGKLWQNATSLVLRRSGALLVLVVGHQAGADPISAYLAGLAGFSLLAWLCAGLIIRDVSIDHSVNARAIFRGGRHYWANSISLQAMNFDVSCVALVTSPELAGYYAAASRLTTPLRIVPTSFAAILFPAAARTRANGSRPLLRAITALTALTTVMYLGLAILLPVIVPLVLGPTFEPATDVIRIVCVGLIFAAITSQLRSLMQGWGHLRAVTLISFSSTVLSLVAVTLAAANYGAIGAGSALALSFAGQLILQVIAMAILTRSQEA
uniref:Polysaccharide biosynthesis protein n=2 Tax=unclassified Mycobacterium TaxID=2642494 RepID=A0A5Q5BFU5_MYCSS